MKNPILEALLVLIEHKKFATYAEIARVTGIKQFEVLRVLNNNKRLIIMDNKGRITNTKDMEYREPLTKELVDLYFENGMCYKDNHTDEYMGYKPYLEFHADYIDEVAEKYNLPVEQFRNYGCEPFRAIPGTQENRAILARNGHYYYYEYLYQDLLINRATDGLDRYWME